jgi:hypothetical protein
MKRRPGFTIAAVAACALGLIVACSGKTAGGGGGGPSSACDDYYQAVISSTCSGNLVPPASEVTRVQARFDTVCEQALALPGSSVTASALEACVSAVKASCAVLDDEYGACSFGPGTLAAGSSCVSDGQCQAGDCSAGTESPDGGAPACGMCAAIVGLGQSCTGGASCGPSAACISGTTQGVETCVAVAHVGAGGACDTQPTQCNAGLVCSTTGTCETPGGSGAACGSDQECAPPLVCPSANGPSTCQPAGGIGGSCVSAYECTSGLDCDFTTHQCTAVTWAGASQPCGTGIRCLVGNCTLAGTATTGTCPAIIPEGQPCNASDPSTSTCDTFANCTGGICVLGFATCP